VCVSLSLSLFLSLSRRVNIKTVGRLYYTISINDENIYFPYLRDIFFLSPVFPKATGCVSPLKNVRKLEYTALCILLLVIFFFFFVDSTSDYIPFKHLLLALHPAALSND